MTLIALAVEARDDRLNEQLWSEYLNEERINEERGQAALEAAELTLRYLEDFDNRINELLCSATPEEISKFISALCMAAHGKSSAISTAQSVLAKYLTEHA